MKKLLNDPADAVVESLEGMALAHPDLLAVDAGQRIVRRAGGAVPGKVALVSGGGAGHEPLHSGFVGRGMLDAACVGQVFTSPVPDQILAATQAVDGGAGVLHVVKNYTGDRLNFEMAGELADASGIRVAQVVTADDVAVEDSTWTAGRRGVALTAVLEKIVGAAAEDGADLERCVSLAGSVGEHGRSMGLALTACTVPAVGRPSFELGEEQIELGVGIHGEPGRSREPMGTAAEIAPLLLEPVLADLGLRRGEAVLVLLNGLGGTPQLELYLMFREMCRLLAGAGVQVARSLVGSHVTSLDMAGCSVTLLRLDDTMVKCWDAPVTTPAWRW